MSVNTQNQTSESAGTATNSQTRRKLWPVLLLAAVLIGALLLAVVVFLPRPVTFQYGTLIDSAEPVADFTLNSSLGTPVALSDFRGKHVLLYFGYTNCPDVCPLTLAEIKDARKRLGDKAEQVQPLFITLDPARDTPDHMAAYLKFFDPALIGLGGTLEEIQSLATRFGIFFEQRDSGSAGGYLVDHTSVVIVIDPQGRLRAIFPNGVTGEQMASDLQALLQ